MDSIITLGIAHIFQGGWAAAQDLKRLRENNVNLLINCTTNVGDPEWRGTPNTPQIIHFPVVGPMVQKRMQENRSILAVLEEPVFNEVRHSLEMGKML